MLKKGLALMLLVTTLVSSSTAVFACDVEDSASVTVNSEIVSPNGAVFPDLSCPNKCGKLGEIEDQFYDSINYLWVYVMYCRDCDTHWYVIQEVNHFSIDQTV